MQNKNFFGEATKLLTELNDLECLKDILQYSLEIHSYALKQNDAEAIFGGINMDELVKDKPVKTAVKLVKIAIFKVLFSFIDHDYIEEILVIIRFWHFHYADKLNIQKLHDKRKRQEFRDALRCKIDEICDINDVTLMKFANARLYALLKEYRKGSLKIGGDGNE